MRPDGKEVYYRAMSQKNFNTLQKTGKMPPTGETCTSPTRAPGTTAELQEDVSDGSPLTQENLLG